ncbi:uncharacterized protein [Antedon mediterranea]
MIISTSVSQDISFDNDYPKDATFAESKQARFVCFLLKNHESTDQVTWMKHNKKLNRTENTRYSFVNKRITDRIYEYSLTIDPVERSDAADYRCVFDTSTGIISSRKAHLNVLKVPSKEYPMCYFSQPSYNISDVTQIICLSEKTSTYLSMEFTEMTELASSHENSTHMWLTLEFPAIPSINNTVYSCKLYIDIINDRKYCYTDPLLILNKLNVVIHGDIQYSSNQTASLTCKGNYTDTAKFTWTSEICYTDNNNVNKLTISSVLPEMHGTQLTCNVYDNDFTGSDTVILTVEGEPMTTTETTRKPPIISPIYTVPLKDVETVIQENFEIIQHFVVVCFILITLIMLCCILAFKLLKLTKINQHLKLKSM